MPKRDVFLIALILLLLLAWSPWLSQAGAEQRAEQSFTSAWQDVADGCGFNCQGCGVKDARRIPFGYRVSITYACGLIPADSPEYHRVSSGFVSFAGTVHGFPKP